MYTLNRIVHRVGFIYEIARFNLDCMGSLTSRSFEVSHNSVSLTTQLERSTYVLLGRHAISFSFIKI